MFRQLCYVRQHYMHVSSTLYMLHVSSSTLYTMFRQHFMLYVSSKLYAMFCQHYLLCFVNTSRYVSSTLYAIEKTSKVVVPFHQQLPNSRSYSLFQLISSILFIFILSLSFAPSFLLGHISSYTFRLHFNRLFLLVLLP